MASQEEDNKLECKSNVNKDQERKIINVYKKYECILNNKNETFEKKIQSLIEVWGKVSELKLPQVACTTEQEFRYIVQIMDWAKLHALNTVLTAEWKNYKDKYEAGLLHEIEKAQISLVKLNNDLSLRCQKLADVVKKPWEDPILERLLSSKDIEIGQDEIEFFTMETAYLTSVRLKKLCESQCEDLALNLVTAFMNCNKIAKAQNISLCASEKQIWFIFDIYIALLFKYTENQKIVALLKELTLEEGLQLIKRFAKKRIKISKIWRHCQKIAILALQVFVSTAAVKFSNEHHVVLENLLDCFISICNTDSLIDNFTKSLRRISQLADAAGLYVFCDVLHRKAGSELKPFTIEMYVRALTTDMNNLERQKNDNEVEKILGTTKQLAEAFCKLAELLNDHVKVARECVLTAFSLDPTEARLKLIEDLATRSGFQVLDTGQEWKCKLHPPALPSDDISWTCPDCGDWVCKPQLNMSLNTNTALFEALTTDDLGISPQLCDDLVVCLSNPRYQILSWLHSWQDLHRLCVMYLNDPERTKNLVTELKFVDIDYSIFKEIKKEPLDELSGIERGYEQYLDHDFTSDDQMSTISEDSASQDSRPYSLGSDGAGDTPFLPIILPPTKSDPNTLKSLRMFRPNLKRSKPTENSQNLPKKIYKFDSTLQNSKQFYATGNVPNSSEINLIIPPPTMHVPPLEKKLKQHPPDKTLPPFFTLPNNSTFHNPAANPANGLVANNSTMSNSKNGLVATLPPHGGQVAITEANPCKSRQHQSKFPVHQSMPAVNSQKKCLFSGTQENSWNELKPKELNKKDCKNFTNKSNTCPNINSTPNCQTQPLTNKIISNCKCLCNPNSCKCLNNSQGSSSSNTSKVSSHKSHNNSNTTLKVTEKTTTKSLNPTSLDKINTNSNPKDRPTLRDLLIHLEKIHTKENIYKTPPKIKQPTRNNSVNTEPKGVSCNTFKGVCVQDIIDKPNGNNQSLVTSDGCLSKGGLLTNLLSNSGEKSKPPSKLNNNYNNVETKKDSNIKISAPTSKITADKNSVIKTKQRDIEQVPKNNKEKLTETVCLNYITKELFIVVEDCDVSSKEAEAVCKDVNNTVTKMKSHSYNVQNSILPKLKELKVVLCRLNVNGYQDLCNEKTNRKPVRKFFKSNVRNDARSENNKKALSQVERKKVTSPLQDVNPRVPPTKQKNKQDHDTLKSSSGCDLLKPKIDDPLPTQMNPRVLLERLPTDKNYARAVLANVPGLNDFEMIRPSNVDHIVNVVQISGGRPTSNVPVQNTQTSTQVSPHIQRIGQPRVDKPEQSSANTSSTYTSSITSTTTTSAKPSTSQPSTLINILSQQIIRPGQSNCVRTRSSPLINILSQQIIRPTTTQITQKPTSNSTTLPSNPQTNSVCKPVATEQNVNQVKNSTTTTVKNITSPSNQGTILQFICKSTLPKFQQAFGKTVYQNSTDSTEASTTNSESAPLDSIKKNNNQTVQQKSIPVNVQPIQGSVIYTRQMPVGQTINLIPPGRGQVFRIATSNSEQISLVKDTVIHSKMSALLAAALQGKQKTSDGLSDSEVNNVDASSTKVSVTRPTLVQSARIVKPVIQIPSNVIRTSPQSNLSSTTLEQLREFDMVYKQIKERSSTNTPSETNSTPPETSDALSQRISVTYVNQGQKYTQLSPVVVVSSYCNLQPAASPALSVTSQGSSSPCVTPAPTPTIPKVATKSSKGKTLKNTTTHTSKSSPIPKPQQKPQEDEHTTQRIFDILAEYAEQLRNSPDLNNKPAPRRRSNPPTNPNQNSKRKKSSSSKKAGQCSSMVSEADTEDQRTMGSEDSSCGVVQLSVPDDDQPQVQSSLTTTESNDSTSNSRQLLFTDSGNNQTRNLIIADSSVGEALKIPNTAVLVPGNYIMPVSMVKGGQQIAVVSGGSKILATVPARSGPNMLLFQSFLNQNRKTGVPTVKYSTIQPLSGISSQSLTGVSAQPPVILPSNSHNLTAVALGQPMTLKKVDDSERVNTELLLTISQPKDTLKCNVDSIQQPDSSTSVTNNNIKIEETVIQDGTEKLFHTYQKSIITPTIAQNASVNKEESVTTIVSQNINMNVGSTENIKDVKSGERVQSVLVTACTSNGPMLSHTPPRYRKPSVTVNEPVAAKEEFIHNGDKPNNNEQKQFSTNTVYYSNKTKKVNAPQKLDRELHQLTLQRKQAVLERELRLQKSLSEECEDLGVDEPSTSDLFPEADLLFDSNHSPSFDQTSQDLIKRPQAPIPADIKDDTKPTTMTLFSDDENSSSLRTDLFEYVEYQTPETQLEYDKNQQLTNGQSSTSNESGSSCEDNTLLQNCASMSDVTLNSPISPPDLYTDNAPLSLNKYKFKYSNKKKGERHKQTENWTVEVSSSEDTTGSTELGKSISPEPCTNKRTHSISYDDELSDGSYKVVRVAISKTDLLKDDESCEELHCGEDDLDCSPSGRGARRSVKKLCSCCNGNQDGGVSRKRPTSRPHTPAPHKKAFINKKR